jgi:hypothetical protein
MREQNQTEISRFLQKQRAAAVKHSWQVNESQAHGVVGRRKAIEHTTSRRSDAVPAVTVPTALRSNSWSVVLKLGFDPSALFAGVLRFDR